MRCVMNRAAIWVMVVLGCCTPSMAWAAGATGFSGPAIGPVPVEFLLFVAVLAGVAISHHHALKIALTGAVVIALYKILFSPFKFGAGVAGFTSHLGHEAVVLSNLLALLLGFAILSNHFEKSEVPGVLPKFLPNDWKGGYVLLVLVAVLSAFLDNIAAALIGGTIAAAVYDKKVHIGFLAAIVAASNAGGAGSVVGDTTTTMMWIAGISPLEVLEAFVGAAVAITFFGYFAAKQQHAFQPIQKSQGPNAHVDWARVGIVLFILALAVSTNIVINTQFSQYGDAFPWLGAAVWVAILLSVPVRAPDWKLLPNAFKGSIFLLALVLCASMMPVDKLPPASWQTAFGLGFVSAVFDNIPLTALAIKQGGYDWGFLAFAVGFGGSMIWFGSSAGVALSTIYPQARSVSAWVKGGWHIAVGYVLGFFAMLLILGFHPGSQPRGAAVPGTSVATAPAR
jgi:Na+/H+ antiporter NhaD/arsenite permease-like protein